MHKLIVILIALLTTISAFGKNSDTKGKIEAKYDERIELMILPGSGNIT